MKLMISIPDELAKKLDFHAERQYKSRSGFIQDLINEYCQTHDYMESIKDLRQFCRDNSKIVKYNTPECEAFKALVKRLDI